MSLPVVLCVGRVYCDVVFKGLTSVPLPGEEIYADGLSLHTGGGAAITAFYLGQLNQAVELCANLPAPPFSQFVSSQLSGNVGLQYCSTACEAEPQITVVLTGDMDRSFITRRVGHALPDSYTDSFTSNEISSSSISHIHIGELATALDHPELITLARSRNWSISLDCAWDIEAMHAPDAKHLIEEVDLFLPNEAEFLELQKSGINEHCSPLTIVKKGAAGAQAFSGTNVVESAAIQTNCIDTTGAGDAFNAGFIHGWLQRRTVEQCLEAGNRCGALAVGRFGGIG